MGKKVGILQSNYIPWKGYFDIMNMVDDFVIFDIVQYTKNDWRNRNTLKTPQGVQWLTIPVRQESLSQLIFETRITVKNWNKKHWNTLQGNYARAPFFKEYKDFFKELYLGCSAEYLSEINFIFLKAIAETLSMNTRVSSASGMNLVQGRSERLLDICKQKGADVYLSGPSAKDYLDTTLFQQEGIEVEWIDYSGYEQYPQLYPPFVHEVTILDLIFNTGPDAQKYMKSFA